MACWDLQGGAAGGCTVSTMVAASPGRVWQCEGEVRHMSMPCAETWPHALMLWRQLAQPHHKHTCCSNAAQHWHPSACSQLNPSGAHLPRGSAAGPAERPQSRCSRRQWPAAAGWRLGADLGWVGGALAHRNLTSEGCTSWRLPMWGPVSPGPTGTVGVNTRLPSRRFTFVSAPPAVGSGMC